jgi:hypothetical protein
MNGILNTPTAPYQTTTIKEEFCLFGFGQIFIKEMILGGGGWKVRMGDPTISC